MVRQHSWGGQAASLRRWPLAKPDEQSGRGNSMFKDPVAGGHMMPGVQPDQSLGCQEKVGKDEPEGLPGPGPESSETSVVQAASLNASVGREISLVGHSWPWAGGDKE